MTEQQFLSKVDGMIPDIAKLINSSAEHLLRSGAIDLTSYDNNYRLPKIFMTAIGEKISWEYMPISKEEKAEVQNIKRFC